MVLKSACSLAHLIIMQFLRNLTLSDIVFLNGMVIKSVLIAGPFAYHVILFGTLRSRCYSSTKRSLLVVIGIAIIIIYIYIYLYFI